MNDEAVFPDLRKDQLQRYAERWVQNYAKVAVDRIALYWYCPAYQKYSKNEHLIPVKYAIVFEISPCNSEKAIHPFTLYQNRSWRKYAIAAEKKLYREASWASDATLHPFTLYQNRSWRKYAIAAEKKLYWEASCASDAIDDFVGDTGYFNTLPDKFVAFMDKGFESVYMQKPNGPFQEEWILIPKIPEGVLDSSVRTDEPSWILFPNELGLTSFPQVVKAKEPDMILDVDVSNFTRVNGDKIRSYDRNYIKAAILHYLNGVGAREVFAIMCPNEKFESKRDRIFRWFRKGKAILIKNNIPV